MANPIKTQGHTLFKRTTIAACIMAATAAHVQAQEAASEDPALLEEVVVYGIKQSLQNAQDIKRDAATVKDVITASDITALPDKSVVEAVQRLPGVSIERFAASDDPDHFSVEGSGVVVRGLNRTRSEINGRDSFSASRSSGLNFADIPAELMKTVEVVKNTTSDLIEGGVSGTINLVTKKPFDNDGLVLGGSIKALHSARANENTPEASLIFSNVWDVDGGQIGFLINGSRQVIKSRSDGTQIYPYYERSNAAYEDPEMLEPLVYPWSPEGGEVDINGNPVYVTEDNGIGAPIVGSDGPLAMPAAANFSRQDNTRERESFASSLQFRNDDETLLLTAEYIRSDSKLAWNERAVKFTDEPFQGARANSFELRFEDGISGVNESFDENGYFTRGIIFGANHNNASRIRKETSLIEDSSLTVEMTPNDNLKLVADLQYIQAKSTVVDNEMFNINKNFNSLGDQYSDSFHYFDVTGDVPQIHLLGSENWNGPNYAIENGNLVSDSERYSNPENVTIRALMDHISESSGDSIAGSFDGEYTFDEGFITSVKAGLRFSEKEQEIAESDYNWGNVSQEWNETGASCADNPEVCEYYDFGDDFHNGDVLTGPSGFWFPRLNLLNDTVFLDEYLVESGIHAINDPDNNESGDRENLRARDGAMLNSPYLPTEIYSVTESRESAYVRADFSFDDLAMPIKGNFGLRYVGYERSATGGGNFGEFEAQYLRPENYTGGEVLIPQADIDLATQGNGAITTIDTDKFTTVLPSLNASMEITEDIIVRFAASKGIFLPDLADVRNNFNVSVSAEGIPADALENDSTFTGIAYQFNANDVGNPTLVPEESVNLDLTAEWYFSDVGSLTFALFNKEIDNIFRTGADIIELEGGTEIFATSTFNSGDASVTGFEIAYQQSFDMLPWPFNGLGTQINYTYIDAEQTSENRPVDDGEKGSFRAFTNLPLEGLSEDTFNFVVFYENELFDTRFAYNWRSEYLLNSRDVISYSPIYQEDYGQLDWSFNYNVTDNLKVGLQATNLLDSVTKTRIQYNQAGVTTPRAAFVTDTQWALTMSANF